MMYLDRPRRDVISKIPTVIRLILGYRGYLLISGPDLNYTRVRQRVKRDGAADFRIQKPATDT